MMVTYQYRTRRVILGLFFLLVGLAFVLDGSGALRVSPNDVWPLLLIALGAGTLLNRARRLQVEEDRSEQLAVAEERVRIARELHDIVAHGVSLMTIQIAAARRVAETKPDASEQSLQAAENTGRQTLSELDSLLAVLRGADASIGAAGGGAAGALEDGDDPRRPLPRLADIPTLIGSLRDAGRDVRYATLGDEPRVPSSVELVLYRVVQEALTNAVRYAGDSPIDVQLLYTPEVVTLFVDDDGPGAAAIGRPGGGHGLVGMAERLAAVGGALQAGPRQPGPGWRVQASVPVLAMAA
jgi:signal transduction histidine kinase